LAPKELQTARFGEAEALCKFVNADALTVVDICYHPNSGFILFYTK